MVGEGQILAAPWKYWELGGIPLPTRGHDKPQSTLPRDEPGPVTILLLAGRSFPPCFQVQGGVAVFFNARYEFLSLWLEPGRGRMSSSWVPKSILRHHYDRRVLGSVAYRWPSSAPWAFPAPKARDLVQGNREMQHI